MARKKKRARSLPKHLRVYVGEGHKLDGNPSRQQLHRAQVVGQRIGNSRLKPRVKLESRIEGGGKRYTSVAWWDTFCAIINEEVPHSP